MEHYAPKGLICPLVTPLTEQETVDSASLRRLVDHVAGYVDAIMLGESSIGDGLSLAGKQRETLIRTGMEATDGRVPLIISITGDTASRTKYYASQVEFFKKELRYKDQIFLMDCPLWYHGNRGLPDHYKEFQRASNLPLILCNNPGLIRQLGKRAKRKDVRTSVLKKLSQNEQIVGMEFLGDIKRFFNYQKAVRGRRDFRFYDGNEVEFLSRPSSGGVIAPGANILPQDWQEIVRSSLNIHEDHLDSSDQIWASGEKIWAFQKVYDSNPVAIIKSALKYMGILDSDRVLDNTPPVTHPQRAEIYRLLIEHELARPNPPSKR